MIESLWSVLKHGCKFTAIFSKNWDLWFFSLIWNGLWLFWPIEYGRSGMLWILRLSYKKLHSFHRVWNILSWSSKLLGKKLTTFRPQGLEKRCRGVCERGRVADGGESAHMQAKEPLSIQILPAHIPDKYMEKTLIQIPILVTPSCLSLLSWGLRYHRAKISHLCWHLCENL